MHVISLNMLHIQQIIALIINNNVSSIELIGRIITFFASNKIVRHQILIYILITTTANITFIFLYV